jgi:dipeptidyl aminopeptidase/acylaminoacyl peptidase
VTRQAPVRRARPARDPYGIAPVATAASPIAAVVGLLIVSVYTLGFMGASIPLLPNFVPDPNNPGPGGGPVVSPAPSNVVNIDPRVNVPGSIVYAKGGNIWVQSGTTVRQLTPDGGASMPAWSPDGRWVYYIQTRSESAIWPYQARERRFRLTVPRLMRIAADGSGTPELVASGRMREGSYRWFYWLRQPAVSPDGKTVALVSDAPDPEDSDVVVQLVDVGSGTLTNPGLPETAPLGHQDPAWHPGGRYLLFVRNGRDGGIVSRYDSQTGQVRTITGPGYLQPEYSPNGRYIVATKADAFGTDVVVIDTARRSEVLRVTNDDRSWAPTWSPAGDAISFLHIENGIVDLRMVMLEGTAPAWTVGEPISLTVASGLDGASRPDWYIPPSQLPAVTSAP